ncbi:DUF4357 domain-containing protein [Candidatus Saccharibacteria bacterium]|nr:DUF4357 domain-containing protein [Candidatus Saccharibacteria bacterium]
MKRTIEIDFDVHKAIETERRGFDDSPNDVLRRLLGLDEIIYGRKSGLAWSKDGVNLPHGTQIRMLYKKKMYEGSIQNGNWIVGSDIIKSPSAAAGVITGTSVNGWICWEVKRPGDTNFISLYKLRIRNE